MQAAVMKSLRDNVCMLSSDFLIVLYIIKNKAGGVKVADRSRTEYSVRNTTAAMISKIVAILMGFATRVVFTHCLSENYVGVNGLFRMC